MTVTKSCKSCPSYVVAPEEQRALFGKAIMAPMCARFGHALGRPGQDSTEVEIHYATSCDKYGEVRPSKAINPVTRLTTASVEIVTKAADRDPETSAVTSCAGCENFLTADAVEKDFGWPVPVCKAKGTAVLNIRREAKDCSFSQPGPPSDDSSGITVLPIFERHFKVADEVVLGDVLADLRDSDYDPALAETEAPVDDEDKGVIRAWFFVENPENGRRYALPRFEREYFTPEEQALIPSKGDEEHPELYIDHGGILLSFAIESYTLDETLCLIGQPGNGKSEFGRYLAYEMQIPFIRHSITEETDPEDFLGSDQYTPELGTHFVPGRLPTAWQRPCVMVSDEFNVGPDSIQQVYRPLTDNSKQLVIGNRVFPRHDYCFHLMTMNPSWDFRNSGTREMADAMGNRLSFKWVAEPPAPLLREIIRQRCQADDYEIPEEILVKMTKIGEDIREMSLQGTYPGTWGIRQEVKVARKTAHYDLLTAYKRAVLDSLDPEVANLVAQAIESHG